MHFAALSLDFKARLAALRETERVKVKGRGKGLRPESESVIFDLEVCDLAPYM